MNEKIVGSLLNEDLIAMYVLFRDGLKVYETLSFVMDNGDYLNVDVDDRGDPIGVEIVYMDSQDSGGSFRLDKNHRVKKEVIMRRLLSASTRLSFINVIQEALAREVNQSLDVIRYSGMYSTTGIDVTTNAAKTVHKEVDGK